MSSYKFEEYVASSNVVDIEQYQNTKLDTKKVEILIGNLFESILKCEAFSQ